MKRHLSYLIILLIVLTGDLSPAWPQKVTFNKIISPDVDGWSIVTSMTQDNQGYMWFSGNGIHRYDGINVVSYRNNPLNPNSLIDNAVETLFGDDNNQLWIGTQGVGLDCFNIITKTFTHYRHQPNNENSVSTGTITAIAKDREGYIWIGTGDGLDRLEPKTGKFVHYKHKTGDSTSLSSNVIRAVYIDKQDIVWIGTGSPFHGDNEVNDKSGGLNRLDKKTNTFTRYEHHDNDPFSLVDNRVRAIFEDRRGTFWVGTAGDGLHTLDRVTGRFTRFPYDPVKLSRSMQGNKFSWVDDHITFIREDATGSLWIGTMMGGISRYDPNTKRMTRYGPGADSTKAFPDHTAWAGYTSRDGIFWVSTWEAGLYRFNPFEQNFPYTNLGEHVHGIYKEANGDTWVCTHSGLSRMNADKKIIKKYSIDMRQHSPNDNVHNLIRDHTGVFWITTDEGLISVNPITDKTERYTHDDNNITSIIHNVTFSIFEDHSGNIWVGTMGGLDRMDRKTGQFIHYTNQSGKDNTFNRKITSVIFEDNKKQLWVGTYEGVNIVDPAKGFIKNYLKGTAVFSLYIDTDTTFWVGGSDGLYRYYPAADSFTTFANPSSGIGFTNVGSIFEDHHKKLWIGCTSGIFRFNQRRDSGDAFEPWLGLKNVFTGEIISNGTDGAIFLSDQTGYYTILPDQVSGNFIPPVVAFTDFRIGEQSLLTTANSILPNGLSAGKTIYLSYKQNVFSFDFDVLHFSNPKANECLYKLENYDTKWRQPGTDRSASYFNVPSGRYTFRVKASSSNGIWTEKSIEVIISPPWWETWWFRILSVIALIIIIYAIVKERSRKLKAENLLLEQKVNERTAQLKKSLEELTATQTQLIQSEKMASLGELTAGIAHEIQNPLNFVNNFSEVNKELIAEMKAEIEKGHLEEIKLIAKDIEANSDKINHHGKRADAIVKGMLQHSRSGTGHKEPTDINALADEYLRLSYHGLRAKDKDFNATMKTDFDPAVAKINIIAQDIGRVLLNLYNNAFYAVNEKRKMEVGKYEPTVAVLTKKEGSKIIISVKDNGNGIPQTIVDKIFQPFFTTKPTGQGTGLGLSLSYDIVKAHGGEIKAETNERGGSKFIIQLPVA